MACVGRACRFAKMFPKKLTLFFDYLFSLIVVVRLTSCYIRGGEKDGGERERKKNRGEERRLKISQRRYSQRGNDRD